MIIMATGCPGETAAVWISPHMQHAGKTCYNTDRLLSAGRLVIILKGWHNAKTRSSWCVRLGALCRFRPRVAFLSGIPVASAVRARGRLSFGRRRGQTVEGKERKESDEEDRFRGVRFTHHRGCHCISHQTGTCRGKTACCGAYESCPDGIQEQDKNCCRSRRSVDSIFGICKRRGGEISLSSRCSRLLHQGWQLRQGC